MKILDWFTYTILGNFVAAALFYPLGLIWWTPMTDLKWTFIFLFANLIIIYAVPSTRRKARLY
jgi:hypothetical protein